LYTVGEVQGKKPQSTLNEAKRRPESGLIGNLDPCFTEHDLLPALQNSVWGDAQLGGTGGFHGFMPMYFVTVLGDMETLAGRFHRRVAEYGSQFPGDAQLLPSGRGHLLGIEARQYVQFAHGSPLLLTHGL
jgi:hypothetical protein